MQFRHADLLDVFMIVVATLMSITSGLAETTESFLVGRMYNIFISYERAQSLSSVLANLTNGTNGTCTTKAVQQLLNNASQSNAEIFCDASEQGNVVNSASSYVCDPDQTLVEDVTTYSISFAVLAASVFIARLMAISLWSVSAYRQSRQMRIAFFQSILRHEIGWFETKDTTILGPLFVK